MRTATIQAIEVAWLLVGLSGLYPSFGNIRANWRERRSLRNRGINHHAQYFAVGIMWIEGLALSIQLVLVLTGIVAMFVPAPVQTAETDAQHLVSIIITLFLFYAQAALSARSWIAFYIRKYIYAYAVTTKEAIDASEAQ